MWKTIPKNLLQHPKSDSIVWQTMWRPIINYVLFRSIGINNTTTKSKNKNYLTTTFGRSSWLRKIVKITSQVFLFVSLIRGQTFLIGIFSYPPVASFWLDLKFPLLCFILNVSCSSWSFPTNSALRSIFVPPSKVVTFLSVLSSPQSLTFRLTTWSSLSVPFHKKNQRKTFLYFKDIFQRQWQ